MYMKKNMVGTHSEIGIEFDKNDRDRTLSSHNLRREQNTVLPISTTHTSMGNSVVGLLPQILTVFTSHQGGYFVIAFALEAKQVYHLKMAKQIIRTHQHEISSTVLVCASDRSPFAVSVKKEKGVFTKNTMLLMRDSEVIAVMIQNGDFKFTIYSFQSLHEGQSPAKK
jgi:hypothetical protein